MENISKSACGQNLTSGNVLYDNIIIICLKFHDLEPNKENLYKISIYNPDILTAPECFKQGFNMFKGILFYVLH